MYRYALLGILSMMLVACAAPDAPPPAPQLSTQSLTHDVRLNARGTGFAPGAERDLQQWLGATPPETITDMTVEAKTIGTAQIIADSITRAGIPAHRVEVGKNPDTQGNTATITLTYTQATAPECEYWAGLSRANYLNENLPSHGCATASNLSHMVMYPADLTGDNAGDTSPEAERSAVVIETYQKNQDFTGTTESASGTGASGN